MVCCHDMFDIWLLIYDLTEYYSYLHNLPSTQSTVFNSSKNSFSVCSEIYPILEPFRIYLYSIRIGINK